MVVSVLLAASAWTLRHAEAADAACDSDIAYGEIVSCNMSSPSQVRNITFSGNDNDRVRVRVIPKSGALNPLTSVRFGAGDVCAPTFADEFTCELTVTGVQTLRVNANGSGTGTFAATIERLNNPSACPALAYGPTGKTGVINQDAEIDCFARPGGAVGQRYFVRGVETSGTGTLVYEVVRPDGSTVCGPTSATDTACLLDAAGTNRIYVYTSGGLADANYRIVLERFPAPVGCTAKAIGNPAQTRPIDDPGEIDCVTFTGSASQDVRVQAVQVSGALNPLTDILRPDGTTACNSTFADDFVCDLDVNGQYTVVVRDGGGTGSSTGTYSLRLLDPP